MKSQGVDDNRLQLLRDVSGAFRPGILTALVGVSGAGKTTLMDVLAGRKTGGYIEGSISISGFPKNQETFARVSGYCEQNDIHSPYVTVYESLLYSAWLRLASDVNTERRKVRNRITGVCDITSLGVTTYNIIPSSHYVCPFLAEVSFNQINKFCILWSTFFLQAKYLNLLVDKLFQIM